MADNLSQQTLCAYQRALEQRQQELASGLQTTLFSRRVEVWHKDGSHFNLNYASLQESTPYLFVFTEHNGGLGFFLDDLESYQEFT